MLPELLQRVPGSVEAVEARLDLHIRAAGHHPAKWWVDVTHHHVWASRYLSGTLRPGRVAMEAEARKLERYGVGVGGVKVTLAACESWARLRPAFDELLRQLEARWAEVRQADASIRVAVGRRWRAELGLAVVRAQHVAFAQSVRDGTPRMGFWHTCTGKCCRPRVYS